jgi:hypothetical protein
MKNNTLYFRDGSGNHRIVTKNLSTMDEVMRNIYSYVSKLNPDYKIYYVRQWVECGNLWFDVGSYTEFFILKGDIPEDEQKAKKKQRQ